MKKFKVGIFNNKIDTDGVNYEYFHLCFILFVTKDGFRQDQSYPKLLQAAWNIEIYYYKYWIWTRI